MPIHVYHFPVELNLAESQYHSVAMEAQDSTLLYENLRPAFPCFPWYLQNMFAHIINKSVQVGRSDDAMHAEYCSLFI